MSPAAGERYVPVSCPVCGESRTREGWNCGSYRFARCIGCGHLYQNPQPHFDGLRARYGDDYFSYELENDANFFDLMLKGLQDAGFFELERKLGDRRRFLDIGCATGMLLAYLKNRDWRVQGVEICEPAARYGVEKRKVPIAVGTLDEAAFQDAAFSFVHFSHVIEHVPDPRAFLLEVNRVLEPGGYVITVTPNRAGLQARVFRERWRSSIADHLNLFSRRSLVRLLSECGFSPIGWKTWGGIAKGMAPNFVKAPLDRLAKLAGFGDVVLVVSQKISRKPQDPPVGPPDGAP